MSPNVAGFFREDVYLKLNPDVAAAVQAGSFSSGWEHALLFGYREGRPGLAPSVVDDIEHSHWQSAGNPPITVLPPRHLRNRVHGASDIESFQRLGSEIANNLQSVIDCNPGAMPSGSNVLDFGCGCGRVMLHLKALHQDWRMYGSDIDVEAISWCQANMGAVGEFKHNEPLPPLMFDANSFDLIYSISVFTHLPEEMQFDWLEEIARVAKPFAKIYLSVHSMELLDHETRTAAEVKGFYYAAGIGTEGLPDFYQTSFHSHQYILDRWSTYLRIETILPRAIAGHQDLVICCKIH